MKQKIYSSVHVCSCQFAVHAFVHLAMSSPYTEDSNHAAAECNVCEDYYCSVYCFCVSEQPCFMQLVTSHMFVLIILLYAGLVLSIFLLCGVHH